MKNQKTKDITESKASGISHKKFSTWYTEYITPLEDSFSANFNILVAGQPRVMGVREILQEWTAFRVECVRRRTYYDLHGKEKRLHLLQGLAAILLDNEDFNEEIKDKLVLVDFYATWCGPCRMMHPIIEEVAKEENIKVIKVDVDKHDELARNYGIMSIPTIILFQNGNLVEKNIGFIPKEQLLTMIKNYKWLLLVYKW